MLNNPHNVRACSIEGTKFKTPPHKNVRIQASLFLILLGFIWGSGYSLAHYATTHGVHPLGYAFWQSLGPAVFLLLLCLKSSIHKFHWQHLRFYLISGLIGIAFPNTNMYFAAPHLPAGVLAVVVNTVPIMTYIIAWGMNEERFSIWRFLGVLLCFVGIMLLITPSTEFTLKATPWILSSLLSPLSFACCAVYSSRYRPPDCDALLLSTGMLVASTLLLTPVIIATGHFYPLKTPFHTQDWVIILEIILSSAGYIIFFKLLKMAGAVFYSLVGGMVSLTGLFWGFLLFHESFEFLMGVAITLIILGIFIVALFQKKSKALDDENTINVAP